MWAKHSSRLTRLSRFFLHPTPSGHFCSHCCSRFLPFATPKSRPLIKCSLVPRSFFALRSLSRSNCCITFTLCFRWFTDRSVFLSLTLLACTYDRGCYSSVVTVYLPRTAYFVRKLPIRHVNGDVCGCPDPIFSNSDQWPRNALMQIVAIAAAAASDFPRYARFIPSIALSHSVPSSLLWPSIFPSLSVPSRFILAFRFARSAISSLFQN